MGGGGKKKGKTDLRIFLLKLPLINASSMVSETVTFPIDLCKTRMQFAQGTKHVSFFQAASGVLKHEGPSGFFSGIQPAILRHWVYSAARIWLYEYFREKMSPAGGGEPGFATKFAIGGLAGGVGQFIASPTDLLKIRMQTDRQKNNPPKYNGIRHCFSSVYAEAGFIGMWRGVGPNVYRAAAVNFGEIAAYDLCKRQVLVTTQWEDGPAVHSLAAVLSGLSSTIMSCPFDVMKTRLMAGSHTGFISCLTDTVKKEGFMALYKGFFPTWSRLGPWQFCFWVTYEKLRHLSGLEGF